MLVLAVVFRLVHGQQRRRRRCFRLKHRQSGECYVLRSHGTDIKPSVLQRLSKCGVDRIGASAALKALGWFRVSGWRERERRGGARAVQD